MDLSLNGAKVFINDRQGATDTMIAGQEAVLEWGDQEAFGEIIWTSGCLLGLKFEDIVAPAVLIATRDMHDELARSGGLGQLDRDHVRAWVDGGQQKRVHN
jgi:hypothetical protein